MAEPKTKPQKRGVSAYVNAIEDPDRRRDVRRVMKMMREVTGAKPVLWGGSMIGYGSYHYTYASGREGDWFLTGLSSRKSALTLYVMAGFSSYDTLMKKLGRFRTGKSCLYLRRLDDIDFDVLTLLVERSVRYLQKKYA